MPEPAQAVARSYRSYHSAGTRYAIYFTPRPDSAWWAFGCAWLGRDPIADIDVAQPVIASLPSAYVTRITTAPRRYGFHATLKPPFRLRPGYIAQQVYLQAAHLASSLASTQLPSLALTTIDGFVALSYTNDAGGSNAVNAIAAQCVSCFDNLRANPSAAELARRHAAKLTLPQARMLAQWGYPYVFDEFRFHLTLTGRLPAAERLHVIEALNPLVAALRAEPLQLDALSVYMQAGHDTPFVVTRRYGFDGSVDVYNDDSPR